MATFAREEFDFELRIAMARVADISAGGRDVRVARYGPSAHCAYAMFAGGGLSWLERRRKRDVSRWSRRRRGRGPICPIFPAAGACRPPSAA